MGDSNACRRIERQKQRTQMTELTKIIDSSLLDITESKSILEKFGHYESIAKEWEEKAKSIVVTREDQLTEMAMAKEARKKFSQLRIDIEKARKEMKEQSLRKGQAIDSVAKFLKGLVEPIEKYLLEQEDFIKIKEQKRLAEQKKEEEEKQEQERLERERLEKQEQERVRLENQKLKEELQKKQIEQDKMIKEVKLVKEEKKVIEKKLADVIHCPKCGHEFVPFKESAGTLI